MILKKSNNLFEFFDENSIHVNEILDILRYDVFGNIYYYGNHFKLNSENSKLKLRRNLVLIAKYLLFIKSKYLFNSGAENRIISNAYFSLETEIKDLGYNVFAPPWQISKSLSLIPDFKVFSLCNKILKEINSTNFYNLTNEIFIDKILELKVVLENFFVENDIKALVFPNDLSFFENIAIKASKNVGTPSFIFLHGLPGRYNGMDDNRADYLLVWGEKIKELYIKSGVPREKIFVTGHPNYSSQKRDFQLRNGLENILVLTQSIPGKCDSEHIPVSDRSNLIYYLYSIKKVLQKLGVSQVRLRCHPGENINWYLSYIDNSFFIPDVLNSSTSALSKSTLIIGPTSTVLLEAIFNNVNYIVYEPIVDIEKKINIIDKSVVPPFDKSDPRIPIAFCENELEQLLLDKNLVDCTFIEEYIAPKFDISIMKNLIAQK